MLRDRVASARGRFPPRARVEAPNRPRRGERQLAPNQGRRGASGRIDGFLRFSRLGGGTLDTWSDKVRQASQDRSRVGADPPISGHETLVTGDDNLVSPSPGAGSRVCDSAKGIGFQELKFPYAMNSQVSHCEFGSDSAGRPSVFSTRLECKTFKGPDNRLYNPK
jgi:hypothetical protein